jgi:hypothetical protein
MRAFFVVILAGIACAAFTSPALAGGFKKGSISYRVSGGYVEKGSVQIECTDELGQDVDTTYPVTDRVTFHSSLGRAGYQGLAGRSVFFLGVGDHSPKLRVTVKRTAMPPVCTPPVKSDCGTRKVKGVLRSQFSGPSRAGRPLDLHLVFAHSRTSSGLTDPFKKCPLPDSLSSWFGQVVNPPVGPAFDFQDRALSYPSVKGFYAHRKFKLAGHSVERRPDGTTAAFRIGMKIARR